MRVSFIIIPVCLVLVALFPSVAPAQQKTPDESALGELPITGSGATGQEPLPKIAILPSLSPDLEDVTVRGIARRDFELTGMYDVIADSKAPAGTYGFDDPIDVDAWKKVGAEAIVKVAARKAANANGKIEVFGIAYFLNVGKDPVYQKKIVIDKSDLRVSAHRTVDALLGALTGRPGGFASHFTYSGRWGKNFRIFSMDSDGNDLKPLTDPALTAIAPAWGPNQTIYYPVSKNFAPYQLFFWDGKQHHQVNLPFRTTIYSVAFNKDHTKMAVAVGDGAGSSIYVGNPGGGGMQKVSKTDLSTHPVFSPSGKLAWIGGSQKKGSQRVWIDNKVISPAGFTAGSPSFCDTEDGVKIVYSVSVGGDRHDMVMSDERGSGITRLTQNAGSNTSPACSPDGRLIAFFSTRNKKQGTYFMSIKRWRTVQLNGQVGESLRWEALPGTP